jgi:lipoprotein-releasing system permease protein
MCRRNLRWPASPKAPASEAALSETSAHPAPGANGRNGGGAMPFGQYERMLAVRYLFATRKDGGVALMSVIAFVGVMLAVAALIAVMSIMNGFRYELVSRLLGINGHIYVQAESLTLEEAQDVAARMRDLAGVEAAYPLVTGESAATGSGQQLSPVLVRGITPEDLHATEFLQQSLMLGSDQEFGVGPNGGNVVYVGRALAQDFGLGVGDSISLISPAMSQGPFGASMRPPKPYVIGDLIDTGLQDYDRVLVYMPLEQAQIFFDRRVAIDDVVIPLVDQVEVRLADADAVGAMRTNVQRALGARYFLSDWRDQNAALFNALQVERSAMRLILMLVVLIAALNIISGFTMLVRDKARDIAILRTVGVEKGSVMRVFLMSGFMLGGLGTLAGLALGVLFCVYIAPIQGFLESVFQRELFAAEVYGLTHLPALVDQGEVMIISAWGFAVSVLVTLIPAWFAARLDPVEALRYE